MKIAKIFREKIIKNPNFEKKGKILKEMKILKQRKFWKHKNFKKLQFKNYENFGKTGNFEQNIKNWKIKILKKWKFWKNCNF